MFTQIMRIYHFHNTAQFTTTSTMIKQIFQIILYYQHITHKQLFTLPFITLCFHHQNYLMWTSQHITKSHYSQTYTTRKYTHFIHLTRVQKSTCLKQSNNITPGLELSPFINLQNQCILFKYIFTIRFQNQQHSYHYMSSLDPKTDPNM